MRLVWGLVAALGLLVGAGLAGGWIAPPEQVTRPATPHEAGLTGETVQPVLAAEPTPPTPTRLPPAAPVRSAPSVHLAQPDIPSGSALAQPTASGAARDVQPVASSAVQANAEASPAPATGARPTAAGVGGARDDVARPHPIRPEVGAPRVSAPTPTPCVLEPPPQYLDTAPRGPEQ